MTDNRKHNGGARQGAGRPSIPDEDRKVTVTFYIKKKHVTAFRNHVLKIIKKLI